MTDERLGFQKALVAGHQHRERVRHEARPRVLVTGVGRSDRDGRRDECALLDATVDTKPYDWHHYLLTALFDGLAADVKHFVQYRTAVPAKACPSE